MRVVAENYEQTHRHTHTGQVQYTSLRACAPRVNVLMKSHLEVQIDGTRPSLKTIYSGRAISICLNNGRINMLHIGTSLLI